MKILVIGNGFDLAHNLPTSYGNFLDFLKEFAAYYTRGEQYPHGAYYDFIKGIDGSSLYDEISENINTHGRLLIYLLSIYEERIKSGKDGWIDFEREILNVIKALEEAKRVFDEHKYDDDPVTLPKRIDEIIHELLLVSGEDRISGKKFPDEFEYGRVDDLLDGLNRITRLLEIYIVEYVEKIDVEKHLPDIEGFTHVLSFNYTDTYEKNYDPDKTAQYCYIHGKAKPKSSLSDCNLVLGINEYLDEYTEDDNKSFVWFKKFYQRIYKGTGSEYIDWLDEFEEVYGQQPDLKDGVFENEVHIFGHSLDATDKDIISRLILTRLTITYVYYYSRKDLANKIENLVEVIGKKKLIQMTGGETRSIRFVEIGNKPAE